MRLLACLVVIPLLPLLGCGDDGGTGGTGTTSTTATEATSNTASASSSSGGALVSIEGDVLAFLTEVSGPRIVGATVSVLEHPEMQMVTGDDAHFRFDGLEAGSEITLLVTHPNLKTTQTAKIKLGAGGVQPFPVQVVPTSIFTAVSALVPLPVEEDKYCVIASTVARTGGSLYLHLRQGMPDVSVTLDPPVLPESGPLYFNEQVLPDAMQPATSTDGGVLFYRVPPGDYTLRASKADTVFSEVKLTCVAGRITNAGPPLGLVPHTPDPDYAAGRDFVANADSAVTDALCETTQGCVNEGGKNDYPATMLAGCKATYRNVWAQIDPACDADRALRDAAVAVYTCRNASCALALGHDEACVPEEATFRAAEAVYGACRAAK